MIKGVEELKNYIITTSATREEKNVMLVMLQVFRELDQRINNAENIAVQNDMLLGEIKTILAGEEATDFSLSFPIVRAVYDLKMQYEDLKDELASM